MESEKSFPPRIIHRFFRWYCHPKLVDHIEGDLLEDYGVQLKKSGKRKADIRFILDVLLLLRPNIIKPTEGYKNVNNYGMYKSYFKIGLRSLLGSKGYSFINISGLSIGVACFTFIALYIINELSYDQFHSKHKNIYRVNALAKGAASDRAVTSFPLSRTLLKDYPEVANATRIMKSGPHLIGRNEEKIVEEVVMYGDSTLFEVFDFKLVKGNPKRALVNPRSLILSESYAKKYFGTVDPIGQGLTVDSDTALYIVTGIFKDIPGNSHLRFDIMGSLSADKSWNDDSWVGRGLYTYIVMNDRSSKEALEKKMQEIVRKYMVREIEFYTGLTIDQWESEGNKAGFSLISLNDIHFRSTSTDELEATGNIIYIYVYALIGFAILAIAIFNFVNLATARSTSRAKEAGVRKVIGSSGRQLIFRFMFESVMISLIAALVAIILVTLLMPSFSTLVGKQLAFGIFNSVVLLSILCLAILVGIIAGCYPAFVLSVLQPAHVLKCVTVNGARSGLRNFLVTMQFMASIVIIIGTITIYNQINFMLNKNLGFDKEQVLVIKGSENLKQNTQAFKNDLLRNPHIKVVASSMTLPGKAFEIRSYAKKDDAATFLFMQDQVSHEYLELLGLEIAAGRFFSKERGTDNNAIVINESAAKAFGFDDPIGKNLTTPWKRGQLLTIIGVVKNYHTESLRKHIEPLALELNSGGSGYISIKMNADENDENIRETVGIIGDTWHRYSDDPFQYFFFDQEYEKLYKSEANTGRVLTIFAILSTFISSLGLVGLIVQSAVARRKEIGIRKVLGAGLLSVMQLLSGQFFRLVLLATLLSWPIAYFATRYWLTNFTEQVPMNPLVYISATLIVAAIGAFTISFQTIKAALVNPVNSLKSE